MPIITFFAGLEILAFPCNQFGGQEPGDNAQIAEMVCTRFKAEFPIFDKVCILFLFLIPSQIASCYERG